MVTDGSMVGERRPDQGFTLLELIVVMALLALTVSLAAPRISAFLFSTQAQTGARRLSGLIQQAALLAQREQAAFLLGYDEVGHRFVLVPEQEKKSMVGGGYPRESLPLDTAVRIVQFWGWYGGDRDGEARVLRFSGEGYVEPAVITLGDDGGREMSLIVSPFVGKVRVVAARVVPDETLFAR
ncbi:MAG: pilus assembly FimT family protein [Desulfobulbus sp.]|jgi:prepilin-type N-terminal cleavage/methylation domain-containing protein